MPLVLPGRVPALGGVVSIKSQLHPLPSSCRRFPAVPSGLLPQEGSGLAGTRRWEQLPVPVVVCGMGGTWSWSTICEVSEGLYHPPCGLEAKKNSREPLCPCWSPERDNAP